MNCEACESAKKNRWCGMYRADCKECSARALSHSPMYWSAAEADAITPAYRDALQAVFGDEWKSWHAKVKAWAIHRGS